MRFRSLTILAAVLFTALPASAQRLPTIVTPDHYDLAFAIDLGHERFEGTETIRVQVAEPTPRVVVHALDIQFRQVTIGDGASSQTATVTLDEKNQTATLTVPRPLAKGPAELHIRYAGTLNEQLRGFYISKTKLRKYAVTQFESTDARRAFPCFDEPAFKATFAVTLTIDRGDTAISNGKVVSDTSGPSITQHTIKFATSPRMSAYLVAMAVGDFKCLDGATDGVPIRICATPDKKDLGRIALEAAQQILQFYNGYYAIKYPFGKLDVVAVPDFAAGAMENTAAIFYRETDLLADAKSASAGRNVRSAACDTAGITVSALITNSEPGIGTGERRPDASGSPSLLRMNFTPLTWPSSPSTSTGLARNSMRTPSRSVSPSSSSSTTSSDRVRR